MSQTVSSVQPISGEMQHRTPMRSPLRPTSRASVNARQVHRYERLANGLGWFSLALGASEVVAPNAVSRFLGVRDRQMLIRAMGVREIVGGVGILMDRRQAEWVWSRVGGDVIDLGLLGAAGAASGAKRGRIAAAIAAVMGVTALDVMVARQLAQRNGAASVTPKARDIHVSASITINRTQDEIYEFWREFENLPRIMRHLESVTAIDAETSHWVAKGPAGTTVQWDAEIIREVENELIAWRSIGQTSVPNWGSVRFVRAPGNRGTQVFVEIGYRPPAGRLGALVAKVFGEEPAQQLKGDLRRLKQALEIGEVVSSKGPRGACAR